MAQELLKQIIQMKEKMDPALLEKLLKLSREESERRAGSKRRTESESRTSSERNAEDEKMKHSESGDRSTGENTQAEEKKKTSIFYPLPNSLTASQYQFRDSIGHSWMAQVRSLSLPTKKELEWYIQKNPSMKELPFWIRNGDEIEFYSQKDTEIQCFQQAHVLPVLHLDQPLQDLKGKNPTKPVTLSMSYGINLITGPDSLTYITQSVESQLIGMDHYQNCDAIQYYLDGLLYEQYLDGYF